MHWLLRRDPFDSSSVVEKQTQASGGGWSIYVDVNVMPFMLSLTLSLRLCVRDDNAIAGKVAGVLFQDFLRGRQSSSRKHVPLFFGGCLPHGAGEVSFKDVEIEFWQVRLRLVSSCV